MRKFICLLLVFCFAVTAVPVMAEEAATEAAEEVYITPPFPTPDISDTVVSVYINGDEPTSWAKALMIDSSLYVPAIATAKLFDIDTNVIDYYGSAATTLTNDNASGYFFENTFYAILNAVGVDLPTPSYDINGILYIPLDSFASLFDIEYETEAEDGAVNVYFTTVTPNPNAQKYESTVNSRGIKSDTDYLIWVSKADYSVRLFTKKNGSWHFENEYPCAIGKSSSPTCEGTFKYYEKIQRWPYDKYYVGPVMRFNRGYALHSTLMRYDNTPYDDRVGVKISAGCVRLHQADIQYLWDTVPLYTTVYVTAD